MSARALPEWVAKHPDQAVPPRVRLRIFDHYNGICQCGCGRKIIAGERWELDDKIALINGGERRESNLRPLLKEHHKIKTRQDVVAKSRTYRKRAKHYGIRQSSHSMPCGRNSPWKKTIGGKVVLR